ncbi:ornithine decarboxylase [Trifolium repens]|nr:ornithine decarboxylase [Trifolium repens]
MPTLVAKESQITKLKLMFGASGVQCNEVVTTLSSEATIFDIIQSIIKTKPTQIDSPFSVLDLRVVIDLMNKWTTNLPTVKPFYAVKCNPNISLLSALASLGSNFDCASQAEIEYVLSLGVSPDRIIYANPCKPESHIKYAASVGVNVTTFDSVGEVEKIKKWHPNCELILRIKPEEETGARFCLGLKYGALLNEVPELLKVADMAGLKVTGVAFHIGSIGADARAYRGAILLAKTVFETASRLGMPKMKILDIGGGFSSGSKFDEASLNINDAIKSYFENEDDLVVIGEPGTYFAETTFTLATKVIGKRVRGELREYWIDDGIYGTLCMTVYDYFVVTCSTLRFGSKPKNIVTCKHTKTYPSTVFGPTCDSTDTVLTEYPLPELEMNDWLVFSNMGAYTTSCATNFNGFSSSSTNIYIAYSS